LIESSSKKLSLLPLTSKGMFNIAPPHVQEAYLASRSIAMLKNKGLKNTAKAAMAKVKREGVSTVAKNAGKVVGGHLSKKKGTYAALATTAVAAKGAHSLYKRQKSKKRQEMVSSYLEPEDREILQEAIFDALM